jgi:hypothetical protein
MVEAVTPGVERKDRSFKMIEMEFIGGPFDGSKEMAPEEIRPILRIPVQLHGVYQLCRKDAEEERFLTALHLTLEEIGRNYR